jgi:hypothetical protein
VNQPSVVTQFEVACRDAAKWLYDARDARRAGHYDEARACLQRALTRVTDAGSALKYVEGA